MTDVIWKIGPLDYIQIPAKELIVGDIFVHKNMLKIVTRSYASNSAQEVDVHTDEYDEDENPISPYRVSLNPETYMDVYRPHIKE